MLNQKKEIGMENTNKLTEKDLEKWKVRMKDLIIFNENWQLIHQKRWEKNSLCWNHKCSCENEK